MAKHNQIVEAGEQIATNYLVKKGFNLVMRNYRKKWGEIDIIAEKGPKLYFIEVKSVSRENLSNVNHETYRPEDNMHPWKLKRMSRTIQTYLLSKKIKSDMEWQVDLLVVYLDLKNKKAKIKVVNNIIL